MDRNVILALALSLLILIGYQSMMSKLYPQKMAQVNASIPITNPKNEAAPVAIEEQVREEDEAVFPDEKEVVFKNRLFEVVFTDAGAGIKRITLNENPKDGLYIPYDVFEVKTVLDRPFLFFQDASGAALNNVKYDSQVVGDSVIFTHNFNGEFILEKRYRFHNTLYLIELELTFKNLMGKEDRKSYAIITGYHPPSHPADERFFEISGDIGGKIFRAKKQAKPYQTQRGGDLNWAMLKNRYFSMIARPFTPSSGCIIKQGKGGEIITALIIPDFSIPVNSSVIHRFGVYAGPSNLELLKMTNIGTDNALSYGMFGSISQLLIGSLRFFHKIFRNWGISIVILSFLINLFMWPLTKKSYSSMQEMQILQPKIEKLKQEFKTNPQRLQKEIMELYKKHKINPMGGCLPMVLQMPVFIALYNGLMHAIELRGAKFLWVRDLSSPENIKLPFSTPLPENSINILPILMAGAMFIQQKMSGKAASMAQTDEQKQQQKVMGIMMTVLFGFIFYSFPSGLVLYWLTNTVIMMIFQFHFAKPKVHVDYA